MSTLLQVLHSFSQCAPPFQGQASQCLVAPGHVCHATGQFPVAPGWAVFALRWNFVLILYLTVLALFCDVSGFADMQCPLPGKSKTSWYFHQAVCVPYMYFVFICPLPGKSKTTF